jgi:hypothetical protein
MEQANSSTAGGETLIDEQQANAGGEQGAQQGGEQGGEQGSQQGAEQGGSQQASSENDGGGAANGQQQAGAQKNGGQQGAGQQAGAGQQGAGQQSGQGQGGKQPGQGAGQMAAGQGSMGQGPGSHGNGHTNEFSPGGPSNDSGSQGVVGTMNPNAKGSQVVTTFGEKAQVKGQLDRTVKPDSVTPFMAPAETPGKTFMGYDPSAIESANQKVKDDLRTGRVSPKHQEIVKDFFNPDEQPQPK